MRRQLSIFHFQNKKSEVANKTVGHRPPRKDRTGGSTAEPLYTQEKEEAK